jgi:putative ABC transport system ATP-binding protein
MTSFPGVRGAEATAGRETANASGTAVLDEATGPKKVMIRLTDVEKVYRTERIETVALSHINLQVLAGEFISIMGPSGSGKSTLLNVMGLLDAPTRGEVMLDGRAIRSTADRELARLRNEQVGFIFQTFHLIGDLNVLDNVEIPLLYRRLPGATRRRMARAALERVGLSARMEHFPAQLSGGQQQRVAVARAIVGNPVILLADEPTGNLDSRMGEEIMNLMHELNREQETTVVMVTHDQRLAERTGRIVRLFDGRQVA